MCNLRHNFLSATAALFFATSLPAFADTDIDLCISDDGPLQFISPSNPLQSWDSCDQTINVVQEGFNTTGLVRNLSVAFDRQSKTFSRQAAGFTDEYTLAGEHIFVLDYKIDSRTLIYNLAARRFILANIKNPSTQIIDIEAYRSYKASVNNAPIFIATAAPTPLFLDQSLQLEGELSQGRLLYSQGDIQRVQDIRFEHVSCVIPDCKFTSGWVQADKLSELRLVPHPDTPLPLVIEQPQEHGIKQCGIAQSVESTTELKQSIAAEISGEYVLGFEFGTALDIMTKTVSKTELPVDLEMVWTVYTMIEYQAVRQSLFGSKYWAALPPKFLVIEKVTLKCDSSNPLQRFQARTTKNWVFLGNFTSDLGIHNSTHLKMFVNEMVKKFGRQIKLWVPRHVGASLSAR